MNCITFTEVNTTKKIDRLSAKYKKMFDYKELRLSDNYLYSSEEEQEEKQKEQEKQDEKATDLNEINEQVNMKEPDINKEIFKNYFFFQTPPELLKNLYKTNDKEKNSMLVSVINSGLEDLKKEINNMSEKEKDIEKPDKIVEIAEEILNKKTRIKNFNTKTNA